MLSWYPQQLTMNSQAWPCSFSSRGGWDDLPFVDLMLQQQGEKVLEAGLASLFSLALLPSVGLLWAVVLCCNRRPSMEETEEEKRVFSCAEAWSPRGADPSCSHKVTLAQEKELMRIERIHLLLSTEYLYIYMHTFKYVSSEEILWLYFWGI